jgi:hypothetical protein
MRYVVSSMLVVVGIIHLLPLSGVLGAERLLALYGVSVGEPNLALLMRHRAVLFGMLGVFLVLSAFKPSLQPIAFAGGLVSVVSFLLLAWPVSGFNAEVSRVFFVDVAALVCLCIGIAARVFVERGS